MSQYFENDPNLKSNTKQIKYTYHGKEIIKVAEDIKTEYGDKFLNNFDIDFFKEYGTNKLLNNLKKDLKRFNVEFDTWFSEKSLYRDGAVQKVLEKLKEDGNTYVQDGAIWLKTTKYNDEKDRARFNLMQSRSL